MTNFLFSLNKVVVLFALFALVSASCKQECREYVKLPGREACYAMCGWSNATAEVKSHMASACRVLVSDLKQDFVSCFLMEIGGPGDEEERPACQVAWEKKGRPGKLGEFCASFREEDQRTWRQAVGSFLPGPLAQLADSTFNFGGRVGSAMAESYRAVNNDNLSPSVLCHEINNPVAVGRTYSVKCIRNQKSASGIGVELVLGAVKCRGNTAVDSTGAPVVKSVGSRLLVSSTPDACRWPFTPTVIPLESSTMMMGGGRMNCFVVPAFLSEGFSLKGTGSYFACGFNNIVTGFETPGLSTATAEHVKGDWPVGIKESSAVVAGDLVYSPPDFGLVAELKLKVALSNESHPVESEILRHINERSDLTNCRAITYSKGRLRNIEGSMTVSASIRVDEVLYVYEYRAHFPGVGSGDSGSLVACGGIPVGVIVSTNALGSITVQSLGPALVSPSIRRRILAGPQEGLGG